MSNKAEILFKRIDTERNMRINSGIAPEQSLIFKSEYFMQKYGYGLDELYSLLKELSDCGCVEIYPGPSGFKLLD